MIGVERFHRTTQRDAKACVARLTAIQGVAALWQLGRFPNPVAENLSIAAFGDTVKLKDKIKTEYFPKEIDTTLVYFSSH